MIGICSRYTRHEATYAALRLAEFMTSNKAEVSIFAATGKPEDIDPRWDRRIHRIKRLTFTEWVTGCDHVIWTHIPHFEQAMWVKCQQKKTSALVLWHELSPFDRNALREMDHLICPNQASFEMLRHWGFRNCLCVPWDCGLPHYSKPDGYKVTAPRLLLPLWDGNPKRTELTVMELIFRALTRHEDATMTVAYNSSTLGSKAKLRLNSFKRIFGDRLTILKQVPPSERFLLFQQHDLTIWPTHYESTCTTALQSIEMGTPVIAFTFRPTNEILDNHNSICVAGSGEEINEVGLPRVIPDYELFDELLDCALQDHDFLSQLQHSLGASRALRRSMFTNGLERVLL